MILDYQCVVLHGLPGAGKTAPATALAYDEAIAAHFGNGILWAGLEARVGSDGAIRDNPAQHKTDGEISTWASAVGIESTALEGLTVDQRLALIRGRIGRRPFLLIIDNVWVGSEAGKLLSLRTDRCRRDRDDPRPIDRPGCPLG